MGLTPIPRGFNAALTGYDMRRDPITHDVYPDLPADPGVVHAVPRLRFGNPVRDPEFLSRVTYQQALCGFTVKVILPLEFDPGDEDSCQKCASAAWESGERRPG